MKGPDIERQALLSRLATDAIALNQPPDGSEAEFQSARTLSLAAEKQTSALNAAKAGLWPASRACWARIGIGYGAVAGGLVLALVFLFGRVPHAATTDPAIRVRAEASAQATGPANDLSATASQTIEDRKKEQIGPEQTAGPQVASDGGQDSTPAKNSSTTPPKVRPRELRVSDLKSADDEWTAGRRSDAVSVYRDFIDGYTEYRLSDRGSWMYGDRPRKKVLDRLYGACRNPTAGDFSDNDTAIQFSFRYHEVLGRVVNHISGTKFDDEFFRRMYTLGRIDKVAMDVNQSESKDTKAGRVAAELDEAFRKDKLAALEDLLSRYERVGLNLHVLPDNVETSQAYFERLPWIDADTLVKAISRVAHFSKEHKQAWGRGYEGLIGYFVTAELTFGVPADQRLVSRLRNN